MFDKKNYVLNCDICDARKMKEEDYNNYKKHDNQCRYCYRQYFQ